MKGIVTIDTTKQQALPGPILLRDMPTSGASLRGIISIDFHDHTARKRGFIGQQSVQFGKTPFGVHCVGAALFARNLLEPEAVVLAASGSPAGAFSNARKVFDTDESMRILLDDRGADLMVGLLLQPSFSPRDRLEPTSRAASAFTLQAFTQSCVMIGVVPDPFARVKGGLALGVRSDSQIAKTYIDANDRFVIFWVRIENLNGEGDDEIKLFLWLIIAQFGSSYFGPLLNHFQVLAIAIIANVQTTSERQNAHVLVQAKAVITAQVIGEGRRARVGSLIQPLETFFRETNPAMLGVLSELAPQPLIGGCHFPLHTARHLRGQVIAGADLAVTPCMHAQIATGLAIDKGELAHKVERITIGQLGPSQALKLFSSGIQFEFRRDGLFHTAILSERVCEVNKRKIKRKSKKKGTLLSSPPSMDEVSRSGGSMNVVLQETQVHFFILVGLQLHVQNVWDTRIQYIVHEIGPHLGSVDLNVMIG